MSIKLIGLDVGTKRIGVAKADTTVRIAVPDGFVMVNGQEFSEIARIARLYDSNTFVVGLPRNNQGEETAQSAYVRNFAKTLAQTIPGSRIYFQDESLTSVEAERRLKTRKRGYTRGDIDSEAAAIILQDCIEHFASRAKEAQTTNSAKADIAEIWDSVGQDTHQPVKSSNGKRKPLKTILLVFLALATLLGGGFFLFYQWYNAQLKPVTPDVDCSTTDPGATNPPEGCQPIKFDIKDSETLDNITEHLYNQKLIRNPLAFKIYARLSNKASALQSGGYTLHSAMSTPEILQLLVEGDPASNVFNFTILPGDTLANIKQKLATQGYTKEQIESAFAKDYSQTNDHLRTLLATKPKDVSYEGYLFGETYQFYNDETVENIIIRAMEQLYDVASSNNLFSDYEAQGLNFHEGLTLASIVQKEAKTDDQPGVARVFLNRLRQGIMLGSDVTASYAVDLVDPERQTYTDNSAILDIDSPYNTRKNAGLPPSPISSPSISALSAVAHPTENDYLYFLTGDDGLVYYSYTDSEHYQNTVDHCKELCNVGL